MPVIRFKDPDLHEEVVVPTGTAELRDGFFWCTDEARIPTGIFNAAHVLSIMPTFEESLRLHEGGK